MPTGPYDTSALTNFLQSGFGIATALIWYVVMSFSIMTIAARTDTEGGWMAWIPILNLALLCKIARQPIWYIIFYLFGCTAPFIYLYNWYGVAEARGKSGCLIAFLLCVPFVNLFVPLYLAFAD